MTDEQLTELTNAIHGIYTTLNRIEESLDTIATVAERWGVMQGLYSPTPGFLGSVE